MQQRQQTPTPGTLMLPFSICLLLLRQLFIIPLHPCHHHHNHPRGKRHSPLTSTLHSSQASDRPLIPERKAGHLLNKGIVHMGADTHLEVFYRAIPLDNAIFDYFLGCFKNIGDGWGGILKDPTKSYCIQMRSPLLRTSDIKTIYR